MPIVAHDLLLRSDDRDRLSWPSAADFELRLPCALRGVERLALVWVRAEPSGGAPFLLRVGDDAERLVDSSGALALVEGPGQLAGPPTEVAFWPRPTVDRLRVRAADPGGGGAAALESLRLAVRVWAAA